MNRADPPVPPRIRLVFEMSREEHPRLYDDLIRFPKGTKRINRLRTLAHDGLVLQSGQVAWKTATPAEEPVSGRAIGGGASLTNQIFDAPITE